MGIDIYADGLFVGHDKEHPLNKRFNEAVTKRDRLPKGDKRREAAQAAISEAYDALYSQGYLRESYHGGPYVTRFLLREAFKAKSSKARIKAAKLRQRLPAAVLLAIYREHVVYGEGNPGEITLQTNHEPHLKRYLGGILEGIFGPGGEIEKVRNGADADELIAQTTPEQLATAEQLIASRKLPPCALDFVDFVEQCAAAEQATGKPVTIRASY